MQRFDSEPDGSATLEAAWSLRRRGEPEPVVARVSLREPGRGGGYDSLAAAHSRALLGLSERIAQAILALDAR